MAKLNWTRVRNENKMIKNGVESILDPVPGPDDRFPPSPKPTRKRRPLPVRKPLSEAARERLAYTEWMKREVTEKVAQGRTYTLKHLVLIWGPLLSSGNEEMQRKRVHEVLDNLHRDRKIRKRFEDRRLIIESW